MHAENDNYKDESLASTEDILIIINTSILITDTFFVVFLLAHSQSNFAHALAPWP